MREFIRGVITITITIIINTKRALVMFGLFMVMALEGPFNSVTNTTSQQGAMNHWCEFAWSNVCAVVASEP